MNVSNTDNSVLYSAWLASTVSILRNVSKVKRSRRSFVYQFTVQPALYYERADGLAAWYHQQAK